LRAFRAIASSAFLALAAAPAGSAARSLFENFLPPPTPKDYSSNWVAVVYSVQEVSPSPQLRVLEKTVVQLGHNWVTGEWDKGIETTALLYRWLGQDVFASSIAAVDLLLPVEAEASRIHADPGSCTITVDGVPHTKLDYDAVRVVEAIVAAAPKKVTGPDLEKRLTLVRIDRVLKKLPEPLYTPDGKGIVKSSSKGYWIELPYLP
jgi:hypothetical protein